jgi:predicted dehydrogenase
VSGVQRHWIECLDTGRTPETSGEDTLRLLDITLGAYESLATGLPYRVGSSL